jgi:small subunit ribosomal protein S2
MARPEFTLKQLLENGVHFGHQTHRWNPLMEQYIYGVRNGIHIIDLTQTFTLLDTALNAVHETVSKGGSILFVGTKRQAQKPISDAAERSAQYYMNHRWLGGTLTNWKTVSNSISRLKKIDEQLGEGASGLTKKERLNIEREQVKLQSSLGGIRDMAGVPELIFVVDTNKESLAIQEAKKLKIPVVAVIDTNSDPSGIDYPIPGNDDAARSIALYCDLVAKAALDGMENQLTAAGVDIGGSIDSVQEIISDSSSVDKIKKQDKATSSEFEKSNEKKLESAGVVGDIDEHNVKNKSDDAVSLDPAVSSEIVNKVNKSSDTAAEPEVAPLIKEVEISEEKLLNDPEVQSGDKGKVVLQKKTVGVKPSVKKKTVLPAKTE